MIVSQNPPQYFEIVSDVEEASNIIYKKLECDEPCMIARFGSNEFNIVINHMSIREKRHSWIKYIKSESYDWWWNKLAIKLFKDAAGFFPLREDCLHKFGDMMIKDIQQLDILGTWINKEYILTRNYPNIIKIKLLYLEPYWAEKPWTRALKDKKVLVIHPFVELIEKQYYEHRTQLFKNSDVLPEFKLQTIKAIQSSGDNNVKYETWFDALQYMKDEIDKRDFDIALIGCGAYGFPLAAHVKRSGKKAVHLGGALQLLFGIKGKRWEDPNYGIVSIGRKGAYLDLFNEHWCRPGDDFKPANAEMIENGCYW